MPELAAKKTPWYLFRLPGLEMFLSLTLYLQFFVLLPSRVTVYMAEGIEFPASLQILVSHPAWTFAIITLLAASTIYMGFRAKAGFRNPMNIALYVANTALLVVLITPAASMVHPFSSPKY